MKIYWALWIIIGFMVPETIALVTRKYQNTLSDTVWGWFKVRTGDSIWHWTFPHLILFAFMIWLLGHLTFRIWR